MSARRSALLAAATLILSVPLSPGETLQNGKHTVEFLGLDKRSAAQIHALLGGRDGVTVHYCAADLIAKAGAADAAVFLHPGTSGGFYYVVSILEPERAGEMRRRTAPAGAAIDAGRFAELARTLDMDESLRNVVHVFGSARLRLDAQELARQMEEAYGALPETGFVFGLLDGLRDDASLRLAGGIALGAGEVSIRRAALAALSNFADREEAWRTLVVACADSVELVREDARLLLQGFNRAGMRKVDWTSARAEIELLLTGANLWALPALIESLAGTEISPELARALLVAQPRWILEHAAAQHAPTHEPARRLLTIAAGKDLGTDVKVWQDFVARLQRESRAQ